MADGVSLSGIDPEKRKTQELGKFDTNKDGKLDRGEVLKMPGSSMSEFFESAFYRSDSHAAAVTLFAALPEKTMVEVLQGIQKNHMQQSPAQSSLGRIMDQIIGRDAAEGFMSALPHPQRERVSMALSEFAKFDLNKDGKLDRPEALKMPLPSLTKYFKTAYLEGGPAQGAALELFGSLPEKTTNAVLEDIKVNQYPDQYVRPLPQSLVTIPNNGAQFRSRYSALELANQLLLSLPEGPRRRSAYEKFSTKDFPIQAPPELVTHDKAERTLAGVFKGGKGCGCGYELAKAKL